jgi:hypothetical protein
MKKVDILAELKRFAPTLTASQMRRLSELTVVDLREILRLQKIWVGVSRDTRAKKRVARVKKDTAPAKAPAKKRVARVKKDDARITKRVKKDDPRVKKGGASPYWRHRDRSGKPLVPWEIEVGPGLDMPGDIDPDPDYFAEEGYSYEDFDTDWGGYEYEDTGYPDEDA